MRVFFAFTQNAAVTFYRFIQPAKYLSRIEGNEIAHDKFSSIDANMTPWQSNLSTPGIVSQMDMLFRGADISVVGAITNPMAIALLQAIKQKYNKKILMEIDDYALNIPGYNIASNVYYANSDLEWILLKQMEISDGLIVSTPELKELYSKYNKNIYVVPNGIDVELWDKVKFPRKGERIRIGFAGSPNHKGDLRILKNVIPAILSKYDVEFYFYNCFPEFLEESENIIFEDGWTPVEQYPQALADNKFDIALAPLKDNNFNRGKSNLRYLEMSMLKIPTIASDLPCYAREITSGVNGYIAKTEGEWIDCLSELIEDEKLRKKMGKKAYDFVVENHNTEKVANIYNDILHKELA